MTRAAFFWLVSLSRVPDARADLESGSPWERGGRCQPPDWPCVRTPARYARRAEVSDRAAGRARAPPDGQRDVPASEKAKRAAFSACLGAFWLSALAVCGCAGPNCGNWHLDSTQGYRRPEPSLSSEGKQHRLHMCVYRCRVGGVYPDSAQGLCTEIRRRPKDAPVQLEVSARRFFYLAPSSNALMKS